MTDINRIDTRFGTDSQYSFSKGNCLPLTGVPFGMNYLSVQTSDSRGNWWFHPKDVTFQGFRLTHQPSPWIGDFSTFTLLPTSGAIEIGDIFHNQTSYRPREATFRPHLLEIFSLRHRIFSQATASAYGFRYRFSFENGRAGLILHHPGGYNWQIINNGFTLLGQVKNVSDCEDKDLTMFVHIHLSQPITALYVGEKLDLVVDKIVQGEDAFLHCQFDESVTTLDVHGATSFLSLEQAKLNWEREADLSFSEALAQNQKEWESYLNRIQVRHHKAKAVDQFYTILYRCFLFPQRWYEYDSSGQALHYNTIDKTIAIGKYYTNNGFWDTYKSVYPLFSLIAPEIYQEVLEGGLNAFQHSGFLPKWLSPDERGMMPGTLFDAVIADAAVKNIATDLMPELLLAMIKTASTESPSSKYGRKGVTEYHQLGYVPNHLSESVNQTQDYAYSDFCIASVAKQLGFDQIAEKYFQSSLNYRNLLDKTTGFMRSKDEDGNFRQPFNPLAWGQDYTEGSAFQNSFAMYHDFQGMIREIGGNDRLLNLLHQLTTTAPAYDVNGYRFEIHEMSELAAQDFGQVAISNQPSFHLPYLYHYVGQPHWGHLLLKTLRQQTFAEGFPGDEDNGSMSAWYVLNCLGLYAVTPGSGQYLLGIPEFDEVLVTLGDGKSLRITTSNNYDHHYFVQQTRLNHETLDRLYVTHDELSKGGHLHFSLGMIPPQIRYQDDQLPYSLT